MKKIILWLLLIPSIVFGIEQPYKIKDSQIDYNFNIVFNQAQDKKFDIELTSAISTSKGYNGNIKLADDGSYYYMFGKQDNEWRGVGLSSTPIKIDGSGYVHANGVVWGDNSVSTTSFAGGASLTNHNALSNLTIGNPHTQYLWKYGATLSSHTISGYSPIEPATAKYDMYYGTCTGTRNRLLQNTTGFNLLTYPHYFGHIYIGGGSEEYGMQDPYLYMDMANRRTESYSSGGFFMMNDISFLSIYGASLGGILSPNALNMAGNINLYGYGLVTTNSLLKDGGATYLSIRNAADTDWQGLKLSTANVAQITFDDTTRLRTSGNLMLSTTQHAGDVTGTYDAMVVGNDSHLHNLSSVDISTTSTYINNIGLSTGTFTTVGLATATLRTDLNAVALSTGTLVKKSGDTMTGMLDVNANTTANSLNVGVVKATGGTVTYSNGYTIHKFTTDSNFVVTRGGNVEILVVGGGGGGGGGTGGGGGAGGYQTQSSVTVTAQSYVIDIGNGGAGGQLDGIDGAVGQNTTALGFTSYGGGLGKHGTSGGNGGSGGGGGWSSGIGGLGISGQGQNGGVGATGAPQYTCGGGGGASMVGSNASGNNGGNGGNGFICDYSGSTVAYADGGGGGTNGTTTTGGLGNGGSSVNEQDGTNGVANTGSGGAGAGTNPSKKGGDGATGIVIIRYPTSSQFEVAITSVTINTKLYTQNYGIVLSTNGSTAVPATDTPSEICILKTFFVAGLPVLHYSTGTAVGSWKALFSLP